MSLRSRLKWALAAYAAIGVVAGFVLEGTLRWMVLLLLAGLAVKSWLAVRSEELE